VSGADQTPGIAAAEASGAKVKLRSKWGGGSTQERDDNASGSGWVLEGSIEHVSYADTPLKAGSPTTPSPQGVQTPFAGLVVFAPRSFWF